MGRKIKYSVEEKISAVEDYFSGIRTVSEIMTDLSIRSTRTDNSIPIWRSSDPLYCFNKSLLFKRI